ncbi:hypothetical protein MMPV_007191 [Pyropia vietnamensis]
MGFEFPDLRALIPRPGRRFSDTDAFAALARGVFQKAAVRDANGNMVIDDLSLVVAMCELHFKVKRRAPGVTQPPTREAVREVMEGFDTNRDGVLDEAEFVRFAKRWWDEAGVLWLYRAALVTAVTVVALPEAAAALRRAVPGGREVPKGLWVGAAGLLFKMVSTAVAARMRALNA